MEYRSLIFDTEILNLGNYQGNAVVNYTDSQIPFTRIVEHKHFVLRDTNKEKTIITKEYPAIWKRELEPYYPINTDRNNIRYEKYAALAKKKMTLFLVGALENINITIWIKWSPMHFLKQTRNSQMAINKAFVWQIIHYGIIGLLSATSDFILFSFIYNKLLLNKYIANIVSIHFGITMSFFLNLKYNFKKTDKLLFRTLSFYFTRLFGLALSQTLLWLGGGYYYYLPQQLNLLQCSLSQVFNSLVTSL